MCTSGNMDLVVTLKKNHEKSPQRNETVEDTRVKAEVISLKKDLSGREVTKKTPLWVLVSAAAAGFLLLICC